MAEALYRKYRPKLFAEVTEQEHVVKTLINQLAQNKVTHAYLFAGPRGVGKTTIARLLAKALNCEQRAEGSAEPCNACQNCLDAQTGKFIDLIEIDAASQTKVEETRENIIENVRFAAARGRYKVFIIDEVHMLSTASFNALLKTLEEPKENIVFILATTELHKLPATIISRCQRFDFHRIPAQQMIERLTNIAEVEGYTVAPAVLADIARLSEGCMRDAESLLGQVLSLGETNVTEDVASIILPETNLTSVCQLADAVTQFDSAQVLALLEQFVEEGGSVPHLLDEFLEFVRAMLIKALSGQDDERYDADTLERLQVCAARLAPTEHQALLDAVLSARGRSTPSQYPQLPLELALIDFCLRKQAPATIVAPPITPVISLAPMNPVAPQVTPMSKPIDPESDSTPPVTTETYLANQADVEDLKGKWGRCVTLVGEQNVSFPLILSKAEFTGIDNGCIIVALPYAIQVAKMNEMKNLRLVEEAVAKIAMKPLRLKFVHQAQPETEEVTDIIEVFGGAVV